MHITRVVTDLKVDGTVLTYKLNGVKIYVMTSGTPMGGIDTTEDDRGFGFNFNIAELLIAIAYDKPGVTIDLKDENILFFLKRTKCI